jgi:ribosomal protein L40E
MGAASEKLRKRREFEKRKQAAKVCVTCGQRPAFRRLECPYHYAYRTLRPKFQRYVEQMQDDEAFLEAASRLVERLINEERGWS